MEGWQAVRIKHVEANIRWDGFEGSEIILPICARSQGVRGRNFTATLNAMEGRIKTLHFLMCDTLDRHNLNGNAPLAIQAADDWLLKNMKHVEGRFEWDLKRWEDVQADPSFDARHGVMKRLYAESAPVRTAIDRISSYYVESKRSRFEQAGLPFNYVQQQAAAADYLVEEFAGTSVYKDWYPGLPEAYWGVYVGDVQIFNKNNHVDRAVDLSLPKTLEIHISRLPAPIVGEKPRLAA